MLLDNLTEEEQGIIASSCKLREYRKGDIIVNEEDKTDSLLFIRKGVAEVRKKLSKADYKNLKELREGDFFGEISFLSRVPRSASVVAMSKCEVLEITAKGFDLISKDYPEIGMKIYRNMAIELSDRLVRNNDDLKKALLWALEGMPMR